MAVGPQAVKKHKPIKIKKMGCFFLIVPSLFTGFIIIPPPGFDNIKKGTGARPSLVISSYDQPFNTISIKVSISVSVNHGEEP
jgi:hypothetical protein